MFVEQIEKTDLMAWFDPSFHGSNTDSCYTRQKSVWKGNADPVKCLTHCTLVHTPTIICWTSPVVLLGMSSLFCRFYSIFDGKSF